MTHLNASALKITLRRALLPAAFLVWLMAVVPSIRYLLAYEGTAGYQAAAPVRWPAGVPDAGDPALPTLLVALHPLCSCSAATLAELEETFAGSDRKFNAFLLIAQPGRSGSEWRSAGLYKEAQQTLHATVVTDEGGAFAAQFGVQTSGDVLFYSAGQGLQRELLFAGGVTGGRGMTGDNQGIELLKAAYHGRKRADAASTPVFGCGLFGTEFATRLASNGGAR